MTLPRLIVALDYDDLKPALTLIDQIDAQQCALKVGSELFTRHGADFVSLLIQRGFRVFLDLKFHDIPNTVAHACKAAANLGVWMLNVHASGGLDMMIAARHALETFPSQDRPLLIAVTVLTSMDGEHLQLIGVKNALDAQVMHLAKMAMEAGLDGVVCSAFEVPGIKERCGQSFLAVTPGIRLKDNSRDDQSRVTTPERAIALGSDYLVVGRSITRAANPAQVVTSILAAISSAV